MTDSTVKTMPGENILVPASKVISRAIRGGFKWDNAKRNYQTMHMSRTPEYTDSFVDEVKATLYTCRVLCVVLAKLFTLDLAFVSRRD